MSAKGHKQTFRDVRVTSALPPIADIRRMSWHVRLVPEAEVVRAASVRPRALLCGSGHNPILVNTRQDVITECVEIELADAR